MINSAFAQNFVNKVNRQLKYDVNIMNDKGIVIASSKAERVGSFYNIAHEIVQKGQLVHMSDHVPDDLKSAASPGVYLLLLRGTEPMGVVGICGNAQELLPVAKTLKFAFESMLEYQEQYMETYQSDSEYSKLAYTLLLEVPINPASIIKLASRMGIKDRCRRIPLHISITGGDSSVCMEHLLEKYHHQDAQDILLPVDNRSLLYLKSMPDLYESQYEAYADDITAGIAHYLSRKCTGIDYTVKFICGIPLDDLLGCRKMYECLSWLYDREVKQKERIVFFKNYIMEYLVNGCESMVSAAFFEYYYRLLKNHQYLKVFQTTVKALIESDMRPEGAAAILYMHKNTVVARLKKIKILLGIQPLTNTKDAMFMVGLFEYTIAIKDHTNLIKK